MIKNGFKYTPRIAQGFMYIVLCNLMNRCRMYVFMVGTRLVMYMVMVDTRLV